MIRYIVLISAIVAICSLIVLSIKQANKTWKMIDEPPVRFWQVHRWYDRITDDSKGAATFLAIVFVMCTFVLYGIVFEYARAKVWFEASGINLSW